MPELKLAARARVRERGAALNEAIVLYEAAIARDSSWAPAWAGLAEATEIRQWWPQAWDDGRIPGPEIRERELQAAEAAARRALELDPRNATAYVALGSVLRDRREVEASEQAYLEALAIDPDNAEAHQQYAELLQTTGRIAEAVEAADRAVLLDATPIRVFHLGYSLYLDDRWEEAIEAYEWGIRLDPENEVSFRRELAWLHFWAGRDSLALAVLAPLEDEGLDRAAQWMAWFRDGDPAAVPDSAREGLDPWSWIAFNRPDSAVASMSDILEDCPSDYAACRWVWDPVFDGMRDHPVVRAAMRKHGLEGMTLERTAPEERRRPLSLRRESAADTAAEAP